MGAGFFVAFGDYTFHSVTCSTRLHSGRVWVLWLVTFGCCNNIQHARFADAVVAFTFRTRCTVTLHSISALFWTHAFYTRHAYWRFCALTATTLPDTLPHSWLFRLYTTWFVTPLLMRPLLSRCLPGRGWRWTAYLQFYLPDCVAAFAPRFVVVTQHVRIFYVLRTAVPLPLLTRCSTFGHFSYNVDRLFVYSRFVRFSSLSFVHARAFTAVLRVHIMFSFASTVWLRSRHWFSRLFDSWFVLVTRSGRCLHPHFIFALCAFLWIANID